MTKQCISDSRRLKILMKSDLLCALMLKIESWMGLNSIFSLQSYCWWSSYNLFFYCDPAAIFQRTLVDWLCCSKGYWLAFQFQTLDAQTWSKESWLVVKALTDSKCWLNNTLFSTHGEPWSCLLKFFCEVENLHSMQVKIVLRDLSSFLILHQWHCQAFQYICHIMAFALFRFLVETFAI